MSAPARFSVTWKNEQKASNTVSRYLPKKIVDLWRRAEKRFRQERYDDAIKCLITLLKNQDTPDWLRKNANENLAAAYYNRGNARGKQGDLVRAIEDCTKAIEIDPENAGAYNNRGVARGDQGDLKGAIEDYTRAIEIDPENAVAYNNRGVARSEQGDLKDAIEDYTSAIKIDPKKAAAYYNRGNARVEQGDLVRAIEDYTRAIEFDPKFASAYFNRGNTQLEQGDLVSAINDYTHATKIDPEFAAAYFNRGIARALNGDLPGARDDCQTVLENAEAAWIWPRARYLLSVSPEICEASKESPEKARALADKLGNEFARISHEDLKSASPLEESGEEFVEYLHKAGLYGVWKDRDDIGDSSEFARKLRKDAEKRGLRDDDADRH
ncbi:MAG: tetratricopeptide repeat protein [Planctomycetes bacterium]|nr:tetratricopeptide repeat protein [Planctomycetota bacterium]